MARLLMMPSDPLERTFRANHGREVREYHRELERRKRESALKLPLKWFGVGNPTLNFPLAPNR